MKITISPISKGYFISNNYYSDSRKAKRDYKNLINVPSGEDYCLICLIEKERIIKKAFCYLDIKNIYFL